MAHLYSKKNLLINLSKKVMPLLFLSLFHHGCVSNPAPKEGQPAKKHGVTKEPFRGKWWHFYERGASSLEANHFESAEQDLLQSKRRRKKDSRRARTYGMHFTEYFPNRELGVLFFRTNRLEQALESLERSLSQEESSRAKYYINQTRKSIIIRDSSDKTPPSLEFFYPEEDTIVSSTQIVMQGTARDDTFIETIWVNNVPIFQELAEQAVSFQKKVQLERGKNIITVSAKDLSGKSTLKKITITADLSGPELAIQEIKNNSDGTITVKGVVYDSGFISRIQIGAEEIGGGNRTLIHFTHTVPAESRGPLPFFATDSAGNTTTGTIEAENLQPESFNSISPVLWASLQVAVNDSSSARSTPAPDKRPPFIKLKQGIKSRQTVHNNSFFIEGVVKDRGEVVSITINGEEIAQYSGIEIHFHYIAELEEGKNIFIVDAVDAAGNSFTKKIEVIRKIPEVFQISSRLSAAIIPFWSKGKSEELYPLFDDLFLNSLNRERRFNLVDRDKGFTAAISELKLNETKWVDKGSALRLGRLAQAELIITGNVIETENYVQIFARVIDSETSEILFTTEVYGEDKSLSSFQYLLDGLTIKIINRFPRLEGNVIEVSKDVVFLNLGIHKSVQENMRFLVFRDIRQRKYSEVKIDAVYKEQSRGEIIRTQKDVPIQAGDRAVTK